MIVEGGGQSTWTKKRDSFRLVKPVHEEGHADFLSILTAHPFQSSCDGVSIVEQQKMAPQHLLGRPILFADDACAKGVVGCSGVPSDHHFLFAYEHNTEPSPVSSEKRKSFSRWHNFVSQLTMLMQLRRSTMRCTTFSVARFCYECILGIISIIYDFSGGMA